MPLDPKLTKFTTTSPTLVSFDFTDFATGTSYTRFNLFATTDSGGVSYALTTNDIEGNPLNTDHDLATPEDFDENFEQIFNNALTIEGVANINYTWRAETNAQNIIMVITISHVRGAVVTQIGTVTSETGSQSGTGEGRESLKSTLSKKHFSKGDSLRIRTEWSATGNGGERIKLFMNPANASSASSNNTNFFVDIPFNPQE